MPSKSNKFNLAGGWTNPSEKYARQLGFIFPIFRDEHKKYLSCHHLVIKFGCKPLESLLLRSRACRSHKVTVAMNQRVHKKWRAKRLWRVARSAAAAALRHHYVIIDRDSKHERKKQHKHAGSFWHPNFTSEIKFMVRCQPATSIPLWERHQRKVP